MSVLRSFFALFALHSVLCALEPVWTVQMEHLEVENSRGDLLDSGSYLINSVDRDFSAPDSGFGDIVVVDPSPFVSKTFLLPNAVLGEDGSAAIFYGNRFTYYPFNYFDLNRNVLGTEIEEREYIVYWYDQSGSLIAECAVPYELYVSSIAPSPSYSLIAEAHVEYVDSALLVAYVYSTDKVVVFRVTGPETIEREIYSADAWESLSSSAVGHLSFPFLMESERVFTNTDESGSSSEGYTTFSVYDLTAAAKAEGTVVEAASVRRWRALMILYWPSELEKRYKIQVSADAQKWVDEGDPLDGNGRMVRRWFRKSASIQYLRVLEID